MDAALVVAAFGTQVTPLETEYRRTERDFRVRRLIACLDAARHDPSLEFRERP